jgi:hypothetical protein
MATAPASLQIIVSDFREHHPFHPSVWILSKVKKKKEKKKEDVLLTKPQLQLTNYFVV